jgi:hypothetical protein
MKGQAGPGVGNPWARLYNATVNSFYSEGWFRSLFGVFVAFMFWYVFNSYFLGFLALAFLFYIPVDPQNPPRGVSNPNFWLFGIMMVVLYMWAFGIIGTGLELEVGGAWYNPLTWNTSAIVFATIWLISLVSGLFGDLHSRQSIGVIMIFVSFVLFASGVGGQDVGAAMFGQWWPTVHNMGSQILTPIGEALGSLSQTLGQGWTLLTNPVGYATQLMNGTHAENPLGESGALGVEITDLTVSQMFVGQPYLITATFQNKGEFDAKDVDLSLSIDESMAPKKTSSLLHGGEWAEKLTVSLMGLDEDACTLEDSECRIDIVSGGDEFTKQNLQQVGFSSKSGLNCDVIETYELANYAIPLKAEVSYTYNVDSSVKVEFISYAEWSRLTQLNMLFLNDVQSEYSTAPVKFPLGTAGLKQPIKADQPFHIGLMLDSDQNNGRIESIEEIMLHFPADFGDADCNPNPDSDSVSGTLVWTKGKSIKDNEKSKIIYCSFNALGDKVTGPTKTYIVTANATYRFSSWKTKSTRLEFGGYCCSSDNCLEGQKCCTYKEGGGGYCIPEGEECGEGTVEPVEVSSLKGYCDKRLSYANYRTMEYGCLLGMGSCSGKDDCTPLGHDVTGIPPLWLDPNTALGVRGELDCKSVKDYDIKACCYVDGTEEACKAAFEEWARETSLRNALLSEPYPYPDMKTIHSVYDSA